MIICGIGGLIMNACTYEDKRSEVEKCMDKYKDYEYCKQYEWDINDEVRQHLNDLLILLEEVE